MDAAESSGISRAPIKGTGGQVGMARPGAKQQFEYSGWNSFAALKNKEPPYVQAYANPLKIKLTPEVIVTAMHLQAVCVSSADE